MPKIRLRETVANTPAGSVVWHSLYTAQRFVAKGVAEYVRPDSGDAPSPETLPDLPPTTANKATWVEYAVSRGMGRAEADGYTKADLIAEYR